MKASELMARDEKLEQYVETWAQISAVLKTTATTKTLVPWIPQGTLEPKADYDLRLQITPFIPETPKLIQNRVGAVFAKGLDLRDVPADFQQHAAYDRAPLQTLAERATTLALAYGFAIALKDTRGPQSTPNNTHANSANQFLALYPAPQVLSMTYDRGELLYLKLTEAGEGTKIRVIEVTRQWVNVWEIIDGEEDAVLISNTLHDTPGKVPAALLSPFPGLDNVGQSTYAKNAQADLAATRILSDILWTLHLLGNPLLTFTTNRTDEQISQFVASASRYIPLKGGKGEFSTPEKMEFLQLDATGLTHQTEIYRHLKAQAKESPNENTQAVPLQESGVAQAWKFKTGEERILSAIANAVDRFLDDILKLAAAGTAAMPKQFDLATTEESISRANAVWDMAEKTGNAALKTEAVKMLIDALPITAEQKKVLHATAEAGNTK